MSHPPLFIPGVRLKNPLNGDREHWAVKSRRVRGQHDAVWYAMLGGFALDRRPSAPCRVVLTRVYAGRCQVMDGDGLQAAFKHVRDTVAEFLKVDDAERFGVAWECRQERGDADGVRVEFLPPSPAGRDGTAEGAVPRA